MATRPDLAKKFNIKSIWEPYIQERAGQAYFDPKTAWPAPTYEHWWPFPFPAPEVPGLAPGAERPTINPGLVQASEGPAGLAGSAPTTMPTPGGNMVQDVEGTGGGMEALPAIAGALTAGAAAGATGDRQQPIGVPDVNTAADIFRSVGGAPTGVSGATGPGTPAAASMGAGIEGAVPLGGVLGESVVSPAMAGGEILGSNVIGGIGGESVVVPAMAEAEIFGPNIIGGLGGESGSAVAAPATAGAATAGAEAGALAGSASAAQGAVGPALGESAAGWGGGAVSIIPWLLASITNTLLDPGRGFMGFGANPTRNFHKTQMMHDLEEGMSHSAFGQALPRATSEADIANVFNSIAQGSASVPGGYLEPEELRNPSVIDTMLKGSLFQGQNSYDFLKALQRVNPSNPYFGIHPMRETPAPLGESVYRPGMSSGEIAMALGRPETQEEEDRRTYGHLYNPNPNYYNVPSG